MKLFLTALVVANLLVFGWFRGWMAPFGGDGREPQRIERQVEPQRLRVVPATRAATGAAPASPAAGAPAGPSVPSASPSSVARGPDGPATEMTAPPPASAAALKAAGCVEVGPVSEPETLRLMLALESLQVGFSIQARRLDDTSSWMVAVFPRSSELQKRLDDLRERGVKDVYVLPEASAWKGGISLGLFKQEDAAASLQRAVTAKGVRNARVVPRGPGAGPLTVQIRPVGDALLGELSKLKPSSPDTTLAACGGG